MYFSNLTCAVFALLLIFQDCHAADVGLRDRQPAPYRIGFIVSLSGPLAEFGAAIRNGVTLATEDRPAIAKVFEPVYEDSRYDSKTAVLNFEKLRNTDRVHAVYVFGGPMSDTLAQIAERSSMPMFSTEYDVRYTRGKQYVVRFCNNAEDYASVLLRELRNRGFRNYSIVKVENQYHNTLSEAFIRRLNEGESARVIENFLPGEKDFRSFFSKLRAEKFDALGVYLSPGMQNAFFRQMKSLGLQVALFGTDSFESTQENSGVEDTVEGTLFANSAVNNDFIARYHKRFNSSAQLVQAALAYEFALLVGERFRDDSSAVSPKDFVQRFAIAQGRDSVCGTYYYRNSADTGQYFSFPIAVRAVKNGSPQIISVQAAP